MYKVLAHELAAQELAELPAQLRGRIFRLVERLETEGQQTMPHSRAIIGGLFELRVSGANITQNLYCYAKDQHIYLLHAFAKKTEKTPAQAIKLARQRLEDFE